MNFKLIKSKEFTFTDSNNTEVKGVNHVVAYKGRVFNLSSLNFEPKDIKVDNGVLTLNAECEVLREDYTNGLGERVAGFKIMPKMDLVLSSF